MIIARICLPGGNLLFHGSVEILGSPAEDDYRMKGWFPVESFNFGFTEAGKEKDAQAATNPANKTGTKPPPAPTPPKKDGDAESAFTSMQIEKEVDRATCHLMVLAMEERSKKKGAERGEEKNKELHADIHVLGSVMFEDSAERNVYPSLMIHLEGVRVSQWNIRASGDGRPSESLSLRYDKAAMYYVWTDGTEFLQFGPKGWDQKKNELWQDSAPMKAFEKYKPQF